MTPRPRPAVLGLPAYQPGKSAAAAQREHDIDDAVKLASNELPFDPLPSVVDAVTRAGHQAHLYADHRASDLRAALADRHGVRVEQVMVGCGSAGLLQQIALAYCDQGDTVVFGWPSFEAYPVFNQLAGSIARTVPLRRQTNDLAGHQAAIDVSTQLVQIANPNNPTGTIVGLDELRHFLREVPGHCLVVLDEAYREFVTSPTLPDSLPLLDEFPNLVILRTFSKAYGLAALRVGYGFGHPDIIATIDKTLLPFAVNGAAQAAALASLDADAEMTERVGAVTAERTRVASEIRRLGFGVPEPQGNFVWLPAGDATADLVTELERRGLVTRGFPGVGLRITIGSAAVNDRLLAAIDELAPGIDRTQWQLPTGDLARRVQDELDDLQLAATRLSEHARLGRRPGLTEPDQSSGEQWDSGQVWAHLAEFGSYWLPELRMIVDADADHPVPFGRTKADPERIASIEANRHESFSAHAKTVHTDIARHASELAQFTTADWSRVGRHATLGEMDPWTFLGHFVTGHYHEHADQLDGLGDG